MIKKLTNSSFLSKPEIRFWGWVMGLLITVAIPIVNLSIKVELLTQKVDNLTTQVDKLVDKYSSVESRWGDVSQRVTILETRAGIR